MLFLLLILISTNAFAEGGSATISNTFPSDGLVLENHVYKNAAVFENLGVYEGVVNAVPVYEYGSYNCGEGYYLPKDSIECTLCEPGSYCEGGEYTFNEEENQGMVTCPDNLSSLAGAKDSGSCGKIVHFGDDTMLLTAEKQTTPAFAVAVGDQTYYGRMTKVSDGLKSISGNTTRTLHVVYDNIEYTVHDASAKDIVKE